MKTLVLFVSGVKVGEVQVNDVHGCAWGPYKLSTFTFLIDLTEDQAQQLADVINPFKEAG